MNQEQQELIERYIDQNNLSLAEAEVFRLLASELDNFDESIAKTLLKDLTITVGFTIKHLNVVLAEFAEERQNNIPGGLIGWMFRYKKPIEGETIPLIRDITVNKLTLNIVEDGPSNFTDLPLRYSPPQSEESSTITIEPKIFFQRSTVTTDKMQMDYPDAFQETLPRMIDSPGLPMEAMEGYFPWADLAILKRSDIDNFIDFILIDETGYDDIFFSGANLGYTTMHNPSLRLEQINLVDSANGNIVIEKEKIKPFTLKAEPYIVNEVLTEYWRNEAIAATASRNSEPIEEETEQSEPLNTGGEVLPTATWLFPCPPAWDISGQISFQAMILIDNSEAEVQRSIQNSVMSYFMNPPAPGISVPIVLEDISLNDVGPRFNPEPPSAPINEGEGKSGCSSIFSGLVLFLFILVLLSTY